MSSPVTVKVIFTSNPSFSVVTAPGIIEAVILYEPVFEVALPLISPPVKENVLLFFQLLAVEALPDRSPTNRGASTTSVAYTPVRKVFLSTVSSSYM